MTTFEKLFQGARSTRLVAGFVLAAIVLPQSAAAAVEGVAGPNFDLTAREGNISLADGGFVYSWGYALDDGVMQLPGPTMIVTEGDVVEVTLTNDLPIAAGNVSILFPGQDVEILAGGVAGSLTQEAPNGGSVTYRFTASNPGTYQYHSGTQPDLQVEMGLYGALIVRPMGASNCAYHHPDSCFDREFLYVLSEIDYDIHTEAQLQAGGLGPIELPSGAYVSEYWLMNGRVGPDTMAENNMVGQGILPHQPYGSLTRMHPGEKVLIRLVGAGRESHPFHHHGNHSRVLANDGRMLLAPDPTPLDGIPPSLAGPLLFTLASTPGGTTDAIFEWTGKDLGWDIYGDMGLDGEGNAVHGLGHDCQDDLNNETGLAGPDGYADVGTDFAWEWCADHGREIPVTLPDLSSLTFGGFWGGSPYLGDPGSLPPGEGGLNPEYGYTFMWHSHTERELVNNDVFPGGMMTMLIVEAPWVMLP